MYKVKNAKYPKMPNTKITTCLLLLKHSLNAMSFLFFLSNILNSDFRILVKMQGLSQFPSGFGKINLNNL